MNNIRVYQGDREEYRTLMAELFPTLKEKEIEYKLNQEFIKGTFQNSIVALREQSKSLKASNNEKEKIGFDKEELESILSCVSSVDSRSNYCDYSELKAKIERMILLYD